MTGNGHPIGVVITRREIAEAFFAADRYFNTFAGNPVSMEAGLAVLDVIREEELQRNAFTVGNMLAAELRGLGKKHDVLGDVHGGGLLLGVEILKDDGSRGPDPAACTRIINELCREGALLGSTGPKRTERNILKVRPPLVFGTAHVDELISKLDKVLAARPKADAGS